MNRWVIGWVAVNVAIAIVAYINMGRAKPDIATRDLPPVLLVVGGKSSTFYALPDGCAIRDPEIGRCLLGALPGMRITISSSREPYAVNWECCTEFDPTAAHRALCTDQGDGALPEDWFETHGHETKDGQ